MVGFRATLFGRFRLGRDDGPLRDIEISKARELLCYLLIYREHSHPRETLAELLWGNQPPVLSKKYLRQTLWKLKSFLDDHEPPDLLIGPEWIQFNPSVNYWLDIAEFERAFINLKNKQAKELSDMEFHTLQEADDLYKGDLLEGWYQDWCLFERERFQAMYLMLLNKLIQYCEIHQKYEAGLAYGEKLLRYDHAYERAHRQMMRLYSMAGDRTQALRQYQRCTTALHDELGIDPSEKTNQLYQQIKAGGKQLLSTPMAEKEPSAASLPLQSSSEHLDFFVELLTNIQSQIQKEIILIEDQQQTSN
jgi:DNA-binding SARP family transcriptional activator